jgi:hypothetical protein
MDDQSHPLETIDRQTVDRLLAVTEPDDEHLVDAARLLIRYEGFPGAAGLREDLEKILGFWKLDRDALEQRTRGIWATGFRPGPMAPTEAVGSGFDTADQNQA